jgi:hypothetical protein
MVNHSQLHALLLSERAGPNNKANARFGRAFLKQGERPEGCWQRLIFSSDAAELPQPHPNAGLLWRPAAPEAPYNALD